MTALSGYRASPPVPSAGQSSKTLFERHPLQLRLPAIPSIRWSLVDLHLVEFLFPAWFYGGVPLQNSMRVGATRLRKIARSGRQQYIVHCAKVDLQLRET